MQNRFILGEDVLQWICIELKHIEKKGKAEIEKNIEFFEIIGNND